MMPLILAWSCVFQASEPGAALEMEMVFVKGGSFRMGCTVEEAAICMSDEEPAIDVSLDNFSIGKYEVTNAQFAEFLTDAGNGIEGG